MNGVPTILEAYQLFLYSIFLLLCWTRPQSFSDPCQATEKDRISRSVFVQNSNAKPLMKEKTRQNKKKFKGIHKRYSLISWTAKFMEKASGRRVVGLFFFSVWLKHQQRSPRSRSYLLSEIVARSSLRLKRLLPRVTRESTNIL